MALFHKSKAKNQSAKGHRNWMNGVSHGISAPLLRLRLAASSCFFGEPMYYHRDPDDARKPRPRHAGWLDERDLEHLRRTLDAVDPVEWRRLTPAALMERAIDEALEADPEATLHEAARLRNQEHMRTTPQVMLVRAAHHAKLRGTGLVRRHAPQLIRRADEPSVGLAYQLARYGKPIPNALKKAWRDALGRADDYALAKYRLESREVKTVDVANLVHPAGAAIDRLVKGTLHTDGRTWESIVSSRGSSRASWEAALEVMGHMALVRNLRNLLEAGVPTERFVPRLLAGAAKGQQLPFRYYSAYQAVGKQAPGQLLDALEACLVTSLGNLPYFPGRVMALVDNSGSAQSTTTSSMGTMRVSTIGNLTGILTGMRSQEGWLGIFGDKLERQPVRSKSSIFDQLDRVEKAARDIGMATENGIWLFWDEAIRKREHWDTVFVYSDMQAGHGGLYGTRPADYARYRWKESQHIDVAKLIAEYRARVNPAVNVFLVQIAGYQDTLVPEFYDRTYILGGWGEGLLRFAGAMIDMPTQRAIA